MQLIKKFLLSCLMFWQWQIWHVKFWRNKTEYYIAFISLLAWIALDVVGRIWGIKTYSIGYFQKLFFGTFGISIIHAFAWFWLGSTFKSLKELIDPDSNEFKKLDQWRQIKVALFFWGSYVVGAFVLASLY